MNIHAWLAAVALAGVAATSSAAWADNSYPTRSIKLVVGFPQGVPPTSLPGSLLNA